MEILYLLDGEGHGANARGRRTPGCVLVLANLRPCHDHVVVPIPDRHHKIKAVSGKCGQQEFEVATWCGRLAEACSSNTCHVDASVADRAITIRRAGTARRRGYAGSQVAKQRVAHLLDSLIVNHALGGINRKSTRKYARANDRGVDIYANHDADIGGRIVDSCGEARVSKEAGIQRWPDQQGRPLPIGRLDRCLEGHRPGAAAERGTCETTQSLAQSC